MHVNQRVTGLSYVIYLHHQPSTGIALPSRKVDRDNFSLCLPPTTLRSFECHCTFSTIDNLILIHFGFHHLFDGAIELYTSEVLHFPQAPSYQETSQLSISLVYSTTSTGDQPSLAGIPFRCCIVIPFVE